MSSELTKRRVSVTAQGNEVADALAEIAGASGVLEPEVVLEVAKSKSHPLHGCFEWDDRKAGHAYRLLQAYKLCAAQRKFIVVTRQEGTVNLKSSSEMAILRKYLSARSGDAKLVERSVALADPEIRGRQIEAFLAELRGWVRRTADIEELREHREAILRLFK